MDQLRDALMQTSAGRAVVVEAKVRQIAVAQRRQQVIELIQLGFPGRPDILVHARTVAATGEAIRAGGPAFDGIVAALKYATTDRRTALGRLGLLKK